MNEENKIITLSSSAEDIEEQLLSEDSPDSLKKLMQIATLDLRKKDVVRATKLSELQDKVVDELSRRIENKSSEFSNKELLEFQRTLQDAINKVAREEVEVPTIQINQQQINIGSEEAELSRESKKKVAEAIQAILYNRMEEGTYDANSQVVDVDTINEDEDYGEE